ncbi:MAG: DUF4231 domain-containing protein [Aureispira sp.]
MSEEKNKTSLKAKVEFLQQSMEEKIQSFHAKRISNKNKATWLHISVTLLGSISTIVLGLEISKNNLLIDYTKNVALVTSALITLISGYTTFFDHKDLWINYTKTRNELKKLQFEFDYYLIGEPDITHEKIDEFKEKYNTILTRANQDWFGLKKD